MKLGDSLNLQRKNGDREQATGFRRADHFQSTVGKSVTSILVLICIVPLITNGILSIFGKNNTPYTGDDRRNNGYSNPNRNHHNNQRW